jgi:hypothetical protein
MPLAKAEASVTPATRLLRFIGKSAAPCRRPITRPVTTKRISVRVSSLARARSSHRADKNCRESAPAAAAALAEPKPHGIPAATPKRFSPSPSKKRSRVTAPGRTVFNSPRARPTAPRAPFRIANRPALEKAAQSRHAIPLSRKLGIAQYKGRPSTAEAQTRHILNRVLNDGLILARNAPSIVRPVCACQGRAPVSRCLHLDSARRAGGLCL